MRQALGAGRETNTKSLSNWADLPGLCCQAAGGHPEWADDLAVAWLLFYSAAHLMDKIQDRDEPDPWWQELGSGAALSAATGLYFSASSALSNLIHHPVNPAAAPKIIKDFYDRFLVMTSGQYSEFADPYPSLERYWQLAGAKSGEFFALATRSAARLATSDGEILDNFERFGFHLGMLIQIRDDLDDVRPPEERSVYGQRGEMARSLPVIFAFSVLQPQDCDQLKKNLANAPDDPQAAGEVIRLLNQSNAALYIAAELEHHRQSAQEALQQVVPPSEIYETLKGYLWKL